MLYHSGFASRSSVATDLDFNYRTVLFPQQSYISKFLSNRLAQGPQSLDWISTGEKK